MNIEVVHLADHHNQRPVHRLPRHCGAVVVPTARRHRRAWNFGEIRSEALPGLCGGGAVWVGSPAEITDKIAAYSEAAGGFEEASMQVNFHTLEYAKAEASIRLFAEQVMPHFAD